MLSEHGERDGDVVTNTLESAYSDGYTQSGKAIYIPVWRCPFSCLGVCAQTLLADELVAAEEGRSSEHSHGDGQPQWTILKPRAAMHVSDMKIHSRPWVRPARR